MQTCSNICIPCCVDGNDPGLPGKPAHWQSPQHVSGLACISVEVKFVQHQSIASSSDDATALLLISTQQLLPAVACEDVTGSHPGTGLVWNGLVTMTLNLLQQMALQKEGHALLSDRAGVSLGCHLKCRALDSLRHAAQ